MSNHQLHPNSETSFVNRMLDSIGVKSIDDLFSDIPEEILLKGELNLGDSMSELEIERHIKKILQKNTSTESHLCFLGGGVWNHHVPSVVDTILSRSEFYTSYTPYQPEVSQGMLQALFEYQSLICDLTGMEVSNSSNYDWATAVGESCRMAHRINKRRRILVSRAVGPDRLSTISSYCSPLGITLDIINFDETSGETSASQLEAKLDDDVSAVYIENPNFFGIIESEISNLSDLIHRRGAILIMGINPISLGILRSPGTYGADIVVGEGQPLGLYMNYGGPLLGIFATREDPSFLRQMPGRIIGLTTAKEEDERGFCMVLQAREQHIRREGATSNLCTNQALCALAASVYLSLLGGDGIVELGKKIIANTNYANKVLSELDGIRSPRFSSKFFQDLTLNVSKIAPQKLYDGLAVKGILGGLPLGRFYPNMERELLFSFTEMHGKGDIDHLRDSIAEML